jgi:UPF0042 nucleotide-binding protein
MPAPLSFVVITGLSGAGKSYAIKCFEDMGFFCVDNLPTTLIPTFADLIMRSEQQIHRVALGVDVREGAYLSRLFDTIRELRARSHTVEVLFLEASEESLVRRYHETRRRHPLAGEGNALDGIRAERKALSDLREVADRILDTSALTVHQLKDRLVELYVAPKARPGLATSLVSFGFKHGVPFDADLVFDVRFLPNPHFVTKLRPLSGQDRRVSRYVLHAPAARRFLELTAALLRFLLPQYIAEGKSYLTIAIGCTGGRHRSIAIGEALARKLVSVRGVVLRVRHRDLDVG